jgi:hypothetical protein
MMIEVEIALAEALAVVRQQHDDGVVPAITLHGC